MLYYSSLSNEDRYVYFSIFEFSFFLTLVLNVRIENASFASQWSRDRHDRKTFVQTRVLFYFRNVSWSLHFLIINQKKIRHIFKLTLFFFLTFKIIYWKLTIRTWKWASHRIKHSVFYSVGFHPSFIFVIRIAQNLGVQREDSLLSFLWLMDKDRHNRNVSRCWVFIEYKN